MSFMRVIEVVPYDPAWPAQADREKARVAAILGNILIRIEHIGSTSVPGLAAKPVIDLMPLVTDITLVDPLQAAFEAAGYDWLGEYGLPGRRYVNVDDPQTGKRMSNVHIYAESDIEVIRHLAFPAYLRFRPDLAKDYAEIKQACAIANPGNVDDYNDCKSDWIQAVQSEAERWWNETR